MGLATEAQEMQPTQSDRLMAWIQTSRIDLSHLDPALFYSATTLLLHHSFVDESVGCVYLSRETVCSLLSLEDKSNVIDFVEMWRCVLRA